MTHPRVAMILDKEVTHQARVLKTAAAAAAAGCDVLVVGQSRGGPGWETRHAGMRIVHVSLLDGASPVGRALARAGGSGGGSRWAVARRRARDGTLLPVLRGRVAERLPDRLYPGWRNVFPQFVLLRRAAMPVLEAFRPDLVHAHDLPALDTGAHARRLGAALVYDAHEYTRGLDTFTPTRHRACIEGEAEHIGAADRIITVSPVTASLLEADYRLGYRPEVVYNAPMSENGSGGGATVRTALGLDADTPLLLYMGEVKPARGLDAAVEALPALRGAHLALVTASSGPYVRGLQARAAALGAADRLHLLPYAPAHAISTFASGASLGISALVHYGNAEATLPNKLFDYLHARLPVVTSDVRASAEVVASVGFGESFRSGDAADFARAARLVLDEPQRYRPTAEALERYSWETQARRLLGVYSELLGIELQPGPAERMTELIAAGGAGGP